MTIDNTIKSFAWAAVIVFGGLNLWWWFERQAAIAAVAERLAEPPENWLEPLVTKMADDTLIPGENPAIYFEYEIKRPVEVWMNVRASNIDTGEERCTGRTNAVILETPKVETATATIAQLAGLEDCDWSEGRYQIGLTWSMNDALTHAPLRTIRNDSLTFTVEYAAPT